jgi:hypothetical protein
MPAILCPVEGCTDGENGDNDYVDLYGESDPVPMVRYNTMINAHDDMINPPNVRRSFSAT